jgi:hypothetical protein
VCVSIGGYAGDFGPEAANTVLPMEIHFPIKESVCMCLILLKSSRLNSVQLVRGIV